MKDYYQVLQKPANYLLDIINSPDWATYSATDPGKLLSPRTATQTRSNLYADFDLPALAPGSGAGYVTGITPKTNTVFGDVNSPAEWSWLKSMSNILGTGESNVKAYNYKQHDPESFYNYIKQFNPEQVNSAYEKLAKQEIARHSQGMPLLAQLAMAAVGAGLGGLGGGVGGFGFGGDSLFGAISNALGLSTGGAAGGTGAGVGTGGAFSGPVAGSSIGNLSFGGLMGSGSGAIGAGGALGGALVGAAGSGAASGLGGGLLSSITNALGLGGNMNSVIGNLISKIPSLVSNSIAGEQSEDNANLIKALMKQNNPQNLLSLLEGSQASQDFQEILKNPETLALFNAIVSQSTNVANRQAAKGGFLPPGTGSLTGGYGDLLSQLIMQNAGQYQIGLLNSLPLNTTAQLLGQGSQNQISMIDQLIAQQNAKAASNPFNVIFGQGSAGNSLIDSFATLFS